VSSKDNHEEENAPEVSVPEMTKTTHPAHSANSVRERILLEVPARAEMWSVVRMTASALAARIDFSFEGVEDLRLAVTELCGACAVDADEDARCVCHFDLAEDRIEVYCEVSPVGTVVSAPRERYSPTMVELSKQILRATVDTYEIRAIDDGVRQGYLCKHRGPAAIQ
jgi:hypothetical protein